MCDVIVAKLEINTIGRTQTSTHFNKLARIPAIGFFIRFGMTQSKIVTFTKILAKINELFAIPFLTVVNVDRHIYLRFVAIYTVYLYIYGKCNFGKSKDGIIRTKDC